MASSSPASPSPVEGMSASPNVESPVISRVVHEETPLAAGSPGGDNNMASPNKQRSQSRKFLPRLGSKDRVLIPEMNEDMVNLETVLRKRFTRNRLINKLLPVKADYSIRMRFCSAVAEYEDIKDKVEKKQKGRKIITMFIHSGSLFQLNGIPPSIERDLLSDKLDALDDLKKYVLEDLTKVEDVKKEYMRLLPEAREGKTLSVETGRMTVVSRDLSKDSKQVDVLSSAFYDVVISPPSSPVSGSSVVGSESKHMNASSPPPSPPGSPLASPHGGRKPRIGSKEYTAAIEETSPDVKNLERVIVDRSRRQELILKLLPVNVDFSVKVRFCSAVSEHNKVKDKVERRAKARKIVGLFVQAGAMFQLSAIPDRLRDDLVRERFDVLGELRRIVMVELAQNEEVKAIIKPMLIEVEVPGGANGH